MDSSLNSRLIILDQIYSFILTLTYKLLILTLKVIQLLQVHLITQFHQQFSLLHKIINTLLIIKHS
jgi:hypothetical protein